MENKMLCPKCGKEIKNVNVISECWQKAEVDKDGNVINYGGIEEILETVKIEHRDGDCLADLINVLKVWQEI
jgi:hypothetical protein